MKSQAGFTLLLCALALPSAAQTSSSVSSDAGSGSSVPDAPAPHALATAETGVQGPAYGGDHEVGFIAGYSGVSGPFFGYRQDVQYAVVTARYSYLMLAGRHYTLRYSPEMTLAARLDEPILSSTGAETGQRRHTYGGGISPLGFQGAGSQRLRIQPFARMNGGMVYFNDRVLSPQGSQFMYTIDFGGGINLFDTPRQAIVMGYRYEHLSNANISVHNPGTDANTFYLGVSWFHTHGVR